MGSPYPPELVVYLWGVIAQIEFPRREEFAADIVAMRGSPELRRALQPRVPVIWSSGRIRANCTFCQAHNNPFQGRVADGAKTALYLLLRNGFRVVNFIHDEVLVELPVEADHLALAREVERIMVAAMQVVIPDVRIGVDYALMTRWHKGAEAVFDNPERPTRLLPWQPLTEETNNPNSKRGAR